MIETAVQRGAGATDFRASFEALAKGAFAGEPAWLSERRRAALARFEELGYPSTKDESWKYTNTATLARTQWRSVSADAPLLDPEQAAGTTLEASGPRVVFVDGRFHARASRLPGDGALQVGGLAEALRADPSLEDVLGRVAPFDEHPFVALNTALFQDGVLVRVPRGTAAPDPLQIVFVQTMEDTAVHPRVLVLAEEASQATIVERYIALGSGRSFTNAVVELRLGAGAVLRHCALQDEEPRAHHLAVTRAVLDRDASLASSVFVLGAPLARSELDVSFTAPGASCELLGLYACSGEQHVDCQTFVDHAVPHCSSTQLYHGVLDGRATGVFNGRVLVREGAAGTNAHQTNRNLLLSDSAHADTKPQLEIYADDVKCSHGATIGQLDEDALFYLRSRGLGEEAARAVLTRAFADAVAEAVRVPFLVRWLDFLLRRRFSSHDDLPSQ